MTMLVSVDSMTPEQLDLLQQQIMIRKTRMLEKEVELLKDESEKMKAIIQIQSQELETVAHRIDNIDCTNIQGDLRDRFNKMIRLYATKKGIYFNKGYRDFIQAYNTAYRTNLELRMTNYCKSKGVKDISTPAYLEESGQLEDAIRVADKMLNQKSA